MAKLNTSDGVTSVARTHGLTKINYNYIVDDHWSTDMHHGKVVLAFDENEMRDKSLI